MPLNPAVSRWLKRSLPILGVVFIVLSVTALYFAVRERETLQRLLHPEAVPAPTMVYSRWLTLSAAAPVSDARVKGWLDALNYTRAARDPQQPGEYAEDGDDLVIFARPFRYPDQDYPAQLIRVEFSNRSLKKITAIAGRVELPSWRLEPQILAEWAAFTKTSKERVKIEELPPHVPRAVLAMEDKRFYDHGAFDLVGIGRAFWVDLSHVSLKQGASTITQQLARSIFLDVQRTWRRKFLEAIMALYLELRYTKPQLLEMYLNQVYWGQDGSQTLIGMESASQSFFGKPARQMTAAESAILAGMLQSPRRYSPRYSVKLSEERKRIVLGLMKDQKVITEGEYHQALVEPIKLAQPKTSSRAPYFLAMIRGDLAERYEMSALMSQGWRIFTTLDPLLQKQAVASASNFRPSPSPLPVGEGKGEGRRSVVAQLGLVSLDPQTGAILAWVGGTNFQTNPFDHVGDAKRQPGSAFKPFVALAALESRLATEASILDDTPLSLKNPDGGTYAPQNYDRKYRGKVSLWDALVFSYNVPMVRLAQSVTAKGVAEMARRVGIVSPLRPDLSIALGSSEVSLLELTGAYGTLASGGLRAAPYAVETVLTQDGRALETHTSSPFPAVAPNVVFALTHILEGVLSDGTARSARPMGFTDPAAGKTGTSENYHDAWFVGYTTALVSGVWVGYDQPRPLGRSAAGIALPIWVDFMKRASALNPGDEFKEPSGMVWTSIDPETGLAAKTGCPARKKAVFVEGSEPTEDCPLHSGGIKGWFDRLTKKEPAPKK